MKRKLVTLLAAALLMMLLTGAAVAATMLWGVEDFVARRGDQLPDVPVQTGIPQSGGIGREATVSVTDALWDGETVFITLHCQPGAEDLLLMDACLALDMPVRNLDRDLPEGGDVAAWMADAGFTDVLGVAVEPMLNGAYVPYRVAWHLEENGGCTLFYEFDGVAEGPLELCFQ